MLSGNRGEWSEVYTLFKLLAEGKLYAGDANLNLLKDVYYPILSIIREESNRKNEYQIHNGNIKILINGNEEISIPKSRFLTEANKLFLTIKSNKSSFQIPELDVLLHSMGCSSLRAASTSKSDIFISLYDERLSHTVNLGFSIKSQLGSDSTLLNAGKSTNFIYEVSNVDDTILKINEIDTRSKIKDRISKLLELNAGLKFYSMENKVFMNNLTLIDSRLPEIISELLLMFFRGLASEIKILADHLIEKNPLEFDLEHSHNYYEYKIKRLLTESALGMTPAKVWNGEYDATGGYLVVKEDGEIVCYHIYNRNQFEDYLFQNTKLDTASSGRNDFGTIFKENNKFYLKLNLQIRFK